MILLGFLLLAVIALPSGFVRAAETEEYPVDVYVVCLDSVPMHGMENASRLFEGVLRAANDGKVRYWTGEWGQIGMSAYPIREEIPMDVRVTEVTDWASYVNLVEQRSNAIIVNAHGEILPIPEGYTKEDWVAKLASAMQNRNITWVHVAGYPFYSCWFQETGEEMWGEAGFKNLTSFMDKPDVRCWNDTSQDTEWLDLSLGAKCNIMLDWERLHPAYFVNTGYPLNESDFRNRLILPRIYGGWSSPLPAAVISFMREGEEAHHDFGFYVHYAVGQTYNSDWFETERDFYVGYAATAVAVRAYIMELFSDKAIHMAEASIANATKEGRTKGLDEAIAMLSEAKSAYAHEIDYESAIQEAVNAETSAKKATANSASFIESYGALIAISSIVAVGGGSFILLWRNNEHKKSRNINRNLQSSRENIRNKNLHPLHKRKLLLNHR